jgi:nucleoside-diphosphate-sugar epimerase
MKKIVVTGATSMIGIALIKECIRNNVQVLAIVRSKSIHLGRLPKSDLVEIYECNLDELASIRSFNKTYDVFYHFAWGYTDKCNRDNPFLQELNIKYTLDAVELANRLGCTKFIGAGSQAEYGRVDHIITPDTEINPFISYGAAKYAAGKLSKKLCDIYGMTHIWGRIFSVYGRYDNEETMLTYAINKFLKNEIAKFSSGTQNWDYLYEDDAGKIFYLLGKCVNENKVYCIAKGEMRTLKEYILELGDLFDGQAKYEFTSQENGEQLYGLQADISCLVKDIGYIPNTPFKKGILNMIEYRKNKTK